MAYPAEGVLGEAVYKAYSPNKAGKIVKVVIPTSTPIRLPDGTTCPRMFPTVRVKWVTGAEEEITTTGLQSLTVLVEENRRKLKSSENMLKKVNNI